MKLDSKVPEGPIEKKWENHKFNTKLVNPANKRKYDILVVGTGPRKHIDQKLLAAIACRFCACRRLPHRRRPLPQQP